MTFSNSLQQQTAILPRLMAQALGNQRLWVIYAGTILVNSLPGLVMGLDGIAIQRQLLSIAGDSSDTVISAPSPA